MRVFRGSITVEVPGFRADGVRPGNGVWTGAGETP